MADTEQNTINAINALSNEPPSAGSQAAGAGSSGNLMQNMVDVLTGGTNSMANGGQAMLAQANSGNLKFDPETGQSLITMLNTQLGTLQDVGGHVTQIQFETKLGMTAGGQAMAKFNQQVSSTGSKAFSPAHQQFQQTLNTMVQAIQVAMENYAKADDDNANKLKPKD
jgi:hypothetical protein